jgi:DMSO/TMAO reductase YedYZ molybdopterin-dependent catalytic subunit
MTVDEAPMGDRSKLSLVRAEPFNAESASDGLAGLLTPTDLHYVRSNFALPHHDHLLHIDGAIDSPRDVSLDELRRLPAKTLNVTLECAGNGRVGLAPLPTGEPWMGHAVATASWTGVSLATVLDLVRLQPDASEVVFYGADQGPYRGGPEISFVRSLPRAIAQQPDNDIIVAYQMNGEPLNLDHGAPLRLIVPRWYGMASVKWLSRIEVRTAPYEGQFQTKSYVYEWDNGEREFVTKQRVKALILTPTSGDVLAPGPLTVRGKAWSGTGAIAAVEVRIDNAPEWHRAELAPQTSPYVWQDWTFTGAIAERGRHVIQARARDVAGNLQPETPRWNRLGYGNNAIQLVVFAIA